MRRIQKIGGRRIIRAAAALTFPHIKSIVLAANQPDKFAALDKRFRILQRVRVDSLFRNPAFFDLHTVPPDFVMLLFYHR